MNIEELDTFLAVVEEGSMLKASEKLFIGQGTASNRIKSLEEKLDVQLINRKKGIRKISLTPEGKSFVPIAQQWSALWNDAKKLKEMQTFKEFRIAVVDLISTFVFEDVYKKFISQHKDVFLTIQTEHSTEIHQMIEAQKMDIGFSFVLHDYPNVISFPLYEEEMVFVFNKKSKFAMTRDPSDFNPENEVYGLWSEQFELWHKYYFPYSNRKKIILGTASMFLSFLETIDDWTIVPLSVAKTFCDKKTELSFSKIDSPPPKRTAFVLSHKYPKPGIKKISKLFLEEIKLHIDNNTELNLLMRNENPRF